MFYQILAMLFNEIRVFREYKYVESITINNIPFIIFSFLGKAVAMPI